MLQSGLRKRRGAFGVVIGISQYIVRQIKRPPMMTMLSLELYYEQDVGLELADRAKESLRALVARIAPHIALDIGVELATGIKERTIQLKDTLLRVPYHLPSQSGRQSLLITTQPLYAEGRGWQGACVVSASALNEKEGAGGNMADILIHEWIHSLEGNVINGRPVPFADLAEEQGFAPEMDSQGRKTWHAWYRYVLGS